jgi:hypothetical protein
MKSDWVTWVLVLLGWWFVHKATLSRERRKEKRELSANICSKLLDLQEAAISFHTDKEFSSRISNDISQQVHRIVSQLQRVPCYFAQY